MRIGICTFYKGNHNYGGILQAYALQKYLEQCGHKTLQICLDYTDPQPLSKSRKLIKLVRMRGKAIPILVRRYRHNKARRASHNIREKIASGFDDFERSIPHTKKSYRCDEMQLLDDEFDLFICGSDQVWAPLSNSWYTFPHTKSYFLAFTKKRKLSYAASFGVSHIPDEYLDEVIPYLKDFDAISVRESSVVNALENRLGKKIDVVVDPTLLYEGRDWIELLHLKNSPQGIIFTYLLGSSGANRECIQKCANDMSLEVDTVPFIGDFTTVDFSFGDKRFIGITPQEFLESIYNAAYVITDSFHCAVFSILFKKQFAVVKRSRDKAKGEMNDRLYDLLKSVGLEDRIYDGRVPLSVLLRSEISYEDVDTKLNKLRMSSREWLHNALQ